MYSQVYNTPPDKSSLTVTYAMPLIPSWTLCAYALNCNDFHFFYSKWNILYRCSCACVLLYVRVQALNQLYVHGCAGLDVFPGTHAATPKKRLLERIHGGRWPFGLMWTSDVWSEPVGKGKFQTITQRRQALQRLYSVWYDRESAQKSTGGQKTTWLL